HRAARKGILSNYFCLSSCDGSKDGRLCVSDAHWSSDELTTWPFSVWNRPARPGGRFASVPPGTPPRTAWTHRARIEGMRLSLYTFVRNGLKYDFHVVPMLRHHLALADEIVVNEGFSTDGTFEAISRIDPKIRVLRTEWGPQRGMDWYRDFKNEARRHCTGDWCVYLDCDEFIPEWQFEPLRALVSETEEDLIPIDLINFYGNYRVRHTAPEKVHWASRKMAIHRNRPDIEFWGDASNLRVQGQKFSW